MRFFESLENCFAKSIVFSGRSGRAEFWWFQLFRFLVGLIPFIGWFFWVVTILPAVSVTVRRLHDINRSGLYLLPLVVTPLFLLSAQMGLFFHLPGDISVEHLDRAIFFSRIINNHNGFVFFFLGDNEKNAFIFFIYFLVALYGLMILWWLIKKGTVGSNMYGDAINNKSSR
ncbi:MAG: DUF805 domain-containing protein [Alphaproteobacteria bacterium]|nr:DUF805 domain-containing protein [Alphaproteobacteria bacterium]